jgi:DNA-binding Lrp family transcriptional regulator
MVFVGGMVTADRAALDSLDRVLLDRVQRAVPMSERPFGELGEACGVGEEEVLARLRRLRQDQVIRQISAIFDTRSLGYASSLVAARIDPDRIDEAAAVINRHPGVSHNYLRSHGFNLWYTIAVAPTSRFGLQRTVELLHRQSGARSTRLLPTLRMFKIGVRFDVGGGGRPDEAEGPAYSEAKCSAAGTLTEKEVAFVRVMQRDLPLVRSPFVEAAAELGIPFAELRELHDQFLASGRMRRFAAVLHHRKAGFSANAMGVWAAPGDEAEIERLGAIMAGFRAVSHCYRRPSFPDWPFNLFTMVHGKSETECEETLAAIAGATGIQQRAALYSTREFKKVRVRYFTDEERAWEGAQE